MSLFSRAATPLPAQPSCEQVGRVLQSFVDGELGPQDAERVAAHLEHCDRCDIEVAVIDRVVRAIRRQRPDLEADVLARLEGFVTDIDRHA
jgi:anti-sigma factor RsiW